MNRKILSVLGGVLLMGVAACQPAGVPATTPAPTAVSSNPVAVSNTPAATNPNPVVPVDNDLTTTASGLKYRDLVAGTGASPAPTDYVTINYTGTLDNGTIFDASRQHGGPIEFPLDQVIPGFTEGVGSMKVGGTRKIVIPPNLAYGSRANGPIPANSTLTFIVELISIKSAPQVKVEDLAVGSGAEAKAGSRLTVNYTGTLENGTVFDASYGKQPFEFQLGAGQVIPGWDKGLLGMKAGGHRRLTIPSELGYGAQGAGTSIPPNATLIFDVELMAVK
jgi:peptidylprolyl isomerase